jgi:SAM-dependent methyltransferase
MSKNGEEALPEALWRIYRRPDRPAAWIQGGNLPWNEPDFSRRMLREHLDESHGAASRQSAERDQQIDWLWHHLGLEVGARVLDITCGPGLYAVELATRGCQVTGVDFSPAAIVYAQELAKKKGVQDACTFLEQDVRKMDFTGDDFDAAIFLYGQLAVFPAEEARLLLKRTARALRPGGRLVVELLDQDSVDKSPGTWWYTDDTGLWGDAPFLHLGERFWIDEEKMSIERFSILHLETGELDEIILCDQSYAIEKMVEMMGETGFAGVKIFPAWDGVPLYDANEWIVYLAQAAG